MAQWLAPLNLVAWGYSQEAQSYLPTESMLPEGGYEVVDCNLGRKAGSAPLAPGIEAAVRWYLENRWWWEAVTSGAYRGERLGLAGAPPA